MQQDNPDFFDVVKNWLDENCIEVGNLIPRIENEHGNVMSGILSMGHNIDDKGETIGVDIHVATAACSDALMAALEKLPDESPVKKFLVSDSKTKALVAGSAVDLVYALEDTPAVATRDTSSLRNNDTLPTPVVR
jgi:hypothetical protein